MWQVIHNARTEAPGPTATVRVVLTLQQRINEAYATHERHMGEVAQQQVGGDGGMLLWDMHMGVVLFWCEWYRCEWHQREWY